MTASTLTERYVHDVVRRIPAGQRADVADELRATIADTIEARGGDDPLAAERDVLNEMGDPILLAASYADRPQSLIGPVLYPAYIRLVTMLLSIVLPIVVVVVTVIEAIDTADVGKAIGAAIGAVLTVGGQMIAWPTVIFALVERSHDRAETMARSAPWSVDRLPEIKSRDGDRNLGGTVPSIVWNVILIALLLWNFSFGPDDDRVYVLDQSLWSLWIWPILAGLVALVAVETARAAKGRWTMALAGCHAAAQLLFAAPLVWVLSRREFFSDELFTALKSESSADTFHSVVIAGVVLVTGYEIVKRFRDTRAVTAKR